MLSGFEFCFLVLGSLLEVLVECGERRWDLSSAIWFCDLCWDALHFSAERVGIWDLRSEICPSWDLSARPDFCSWDLTSAFWFWDLLMSSLVQPFYE